MSDWTASDLDAIASAGELRVASTRPSGELSPFTPIWSVGVDGDLFVRSYQGDAGVWYRAAVRRGRGRIRAGGVERDVRFVHDEAAPAEAIDDAYRAKYGGSSYLSPMLTARARAATVRIEPAD